MCHAGEDSLADAPYRDWAFGEWLVSPSLFERKPKAGKPPKPEVENARVPTLVVSPAKAKAICRHAQLKLGQSAPVLCPFLLLYLLPATVPCLLLYTAALAPMCSLGLDAR